MTQTALHEVRVLDFSRVLAGPFCTMLLADSGAEVIKIEAPGRGDDTRQWGPPYAGAADDLMSAYFLSVNRNKRSLTLNLKAPEGQRIAHALALKSDVLIENFKVGQMQTYGLDYERLHAEHPALVYCSITGYGQTSPYAHRPGYDYVIQAQSGLMSITGAVDGEPHKVGVAIADVLTGLFAANAIQTALLSRHRTGRGQHIDVALLDSQIAALVNVASNFLISRKTPARYGNQHANIVPYQTFEASDGHFVLAVGNDSQFRACCEVIGLPELASDDRYATNPARVSNREALIRTLAPIFRQKSVQTWVEALLQAGIPAGEINDIPAALQMPHAGDLVQEVTLANGAVIDLLAPTTRFSETPASIHRPPPLLGQDTNDILRDVLGITDSEIAAYREKGII